ncbi:MAG: TolC family protein [Planctomycetota bacterium]
MQQRNFDRSLWRVSAVVLILLAAPAARAAARQLTAADLERLALERNRELLSTRQEIAAARGFVTQSRLRPNPGLDVTFETGRPLGSRGEREIEIGYAHTFETAGKRTRRIDVARVGVEIAELEVADRERHLRADVRIRFAEVLSARRNLEVLRDLAGLTDRASRATQQRVAEGEAAPVERALLQVELGRLTADRILSESAAARALGALRLTVGMDTDEPLTLAGDLTQSRQAVTLESAMASALEQRPDLRAARAAERQAEAEVALARAERTPDVIGIARYSQSDSRFDLFGTTASGQLAPVVDRDHTLTVGVSIPLPFANRNQGHIETAQARRQAAMQRRQFIEDVVRTEVRAAYEQYVASADALRTFDADVVMQAQEGMTVIRATYELGEVPLLDLLQEQRRLVDTQRAYTEILKDHYIAGAVLVQAIGAEVK